VWEVPDCSSVEQAAGVSLVALTAAQAVWHRLGLKAPFTYDEDSVLAEYPEWTVSRKRDPTALINVFKHGASISVEIFAAQVEKRFICSVQPAN
jgi:NADPH:quinone reductase-like Zn-dependent oxidoreductase